jgi:hypothetical protein
MGLLHEAAVCPQQEVSTRSAAWLYFSRTAPLMVTSVMTFS